MTLMADRAAMAALKANDAYAPTNPDYSTAKILHLDEAMEQARQAEIRAVSALAAAREAAASAEWSFHEAVLGAKAQVMAQFGPNSDAIQSLGLKKKIDRKRPARRSRTQASAAV
jgi:hypothetical protein